MNWLVVDVEANCCNDDRFPDYEREVIEIGAVMARTTGRVIGQWQSFIKPVKHELTEFCTNLTGITNEDLADAPKFPECWSAFWLWLNNYDCMFCSWGDVDRRVLRADCFHHGEIRSLGDHVDLAKEFRKTQKTGKIGVGRALRSKGLKRIGTKHRGLDDALTRAQLLPFCGLDQ